jgi:copper homeostasis protein
MLRPRGGDFCYSRSDFEAMALDGSFLKDEGADYIVFGILKPDGNVDAERCYSMMGQCGSRKTPLSFVFHMAFDETPDWRRALDTLVELKFSRILSKGQAVNAEAGAETLRHMIRYAGSRIEILPGGGVRAHNVRDIIKKTGCDQIHFSLRKNEKEFFSEQEIKDLIALCRRP